MDQSDAAIPCQADRRRHRAKRDTWRMRWLRATFAGGVLVMVNACSGGSLGMADRSAPDPRQHMTRDDRHIAAVTMQIAMERREDNEASTWTNGLSGNHGAVVPRRTYRTRTGDFCRLFDETMTVSGVTATFERTACRDGDGRWTALT